MPLFPVFQSMLLDSQRKAAATPSSFIHRRGPGSYADTSIVPLSYLRLITSPTRAKAPKPPSPSTVITALAQKAFRDASSSSSTDIKRAEKATQPLLLLTTSPIITIYESLDATERIPYPIARSPLTPSHKRKVSTDTTASSSSNAISETSSASSRATADTEQTTISDVAPEEDKPEVAVHHQDDEEQEKPYHGPYYEAPANGDEEPAESDEPEEETVPQYPYITKRQWANVWQRVRQVSAQLRAERERLDDWNPPDVSGHTADREEHFGDLRDTAAGTCDQTEAYDRPIDVSSGRISVKEALQAFVDDDESDDDGLCTSEPAPVTRADAHLSSLADTILPSIVISLPTRPRAHDDFSEDEEEDDATSVYGGDVELENTTPNSDLEDALEEYISGGDDGDDDAIAAVLLAERARNLEAAEERLADATASGEESRGEYAYKGEGDRFGGCRFMEVRSTQVLSSVEAEDALMLYVGAMEGDGYGEEDYY